MASDNDLFFPKKVKVKPTVEPGEHYHFDKEREILYIRKDHPKKVNSREYRKRKDG